MANVSEHWNARRAELSMAGLLDPVALEARLAEARARRSVALAAKVVVAQPPGLAPSSPPQLSTAGIAPVSRPAIARPAPHRLRFILPVLLAGLGAGAAAVLGVAPLLRQQAAAPTTSTSVADPSASIAAASPGLPDPRRFAANIAPLPDPQALAADVAPLAPESQPGQGQPQPPARVPQQPAKATVKPISDPADFTLGTAALTSDSLVRSGADPHGLSDPIFATGGGPLTEPTSTGGPSNHQPSGIDTQPTARPAHQSPDGTVDSPPSVPSIRTPTRSVVASPGHARSAHGQPSRSTWGRSRSGSAQSGKGYSGQSRIGHGNASNSGNAGKTGGNSGKGGGHDSSAKGGGHSNSDKGGGHDSSAKGGGHGNSDKGGGHSGRGGSH